ncbi:MAG: hypothetical protein HY963_04760 [Ignavibacteriales bacterium]|nr:hypothetical protein [Ignavibacteriales bacterium]
MRYPLSIILFFLEIIFLKIPIQAQSKIDFSKIANTSNLSFKVWTTEEGLPSKDIYDIVKGKNGFYYLGTSHGFVRFDGAEFKIYNTKNTDQIKANVTRNLFMDSQGKIWMGNGGAGILIYDGNKFERISEEQGLSLNHPSCFEEDADGRIFIGTHGGGLNIYDHGKFYVIKKEDGLTSNSISTILYDSKNILWIGSNDQDLLFMEKGKIKKYFDVTRKQFSRITKLYEDSNGTIWVGTDNGIMKIKNGFSLPDKNLALLNNGFINNITEDEDRNIWFATSKGVFIYNSKKLIRLGMDNVLLTDRISQILLNNDGIWMCSRGAGLARLTLNKIKVISEDQGLPDKIVRTVFQDHSGTIWFGTNKGIIRYDEKSGKLISSKLPKPILVPYAWTSNLKGEIFIGTRNSGVWKYSNGSLKNIADKRILGTSFVRSLYYDNDNTLWIGTNGGGVAMYKDGKFKFINKSTGLKSEFVACIVKNKTGQFWIGTSGGGASLVDKNGTVLKTITEKDGLASNIVSSINEDETGIVWISTGVFGISRFKDGKIFNIQEKDGIYSNSIKKMIYDNNGKFWCTSEFGLFSLDQNRLNDYAEGRIPKMTFNLYGKKDGMKSDEFHGLSNNAACLSKSGKLYFPTADGVVIVNPKELQSDKEKPTAYIDEVFVNYKLISKDDIRTFSPGTETIQFNYGGISINYSKNLSFKYILVGLDTNWADVGKRRQAFFTHLPYGNYIFKVVAIAPDGRRSNNAASINFSIEPFIWQTLWFRIGFLIFLITSSAFIVQYILKRKYKARLDKLEAEAAIERERMRISKDMHDELGASLTKISLITELAKRNINDNALLQKDLQNISAASQEVTMTMDEIVWAVNPQNDKLDRLIGYIASYVQEYISLTNLQFSLTVPDQLQDQFVSTEIRHNIFLVIKEAVNNIVKHSHATEVKLEISFSGNELQFQLIDNGVGIKDPVDEFGNGLINMRKRIEDVKGTLQIENNKPNGTIIIGIVPINLSHIRVIS